MALCNVLSLGGNDLHCSSDAQVRMITMRGQDMELCMHHAQLWMTRALREHRVLVLKLIESERE